MKSGNIWNKRSMLNVKHIPWFIINYYLQAAGDIHLAIHCLNLCISSNSSHAPGFNNLAVLHYKIGRKNLAKAYFNSARSSESAPVELQINLDYLQNDFNVTLWNGKKNSLYLFLQFYSSVLWIPYSLMVLFTCFSATYINYGFPAKN